jgi:hypothetical protein
MTNRAGVPTSRQRFATAAATCVLPQPLGPESTSQPDGVSAKARASSTQRWKRSWSRGLLLRPRTLRFPNVRRVSGPRLL